MSEHTDGAAPIGHNQPPEETPFETVKARIDDLYTEAGHWLDGEPIDTAKKANAVNKLMEMLRGAEKEADELRKEEVKPVNDAKTEIQARYNPLIQKDKGKTAKAIGMCKIALKPWLEKLAAEKEAAEQRAREEAEAERVKAQQAMRAAQATGNLEAREEAERLAENAKLAEQAEKAVHKQSAGLKGTSRTTSLRTSYEPTITDPTAVCRYYWETRRERLLWKIMELVKDDIAAGSRSIPGVEITEVKNVV